MVHMHPVCSLIGYLPTYHKAAMEMERVLNIIYKQSATAAGYSAKGSSSSIPARRAGGVSYT